MKVVTAAVVLVSMFAVSAPVLAQGGRANQAPGPSVTVNGQTFTQQALFQRNIGGPNDMYTAVPPHKVIGNIYYVGTKSLAVFLVVTPAGNILINTTFERNVPLIQQSIEQLGFKFADTKIILGSHAHGDHDQGAKLLQDRYGARIIMAPPDWDTTMKATSMPGGVPRRDMDATDGQKLTLGDTTITIIQTPGHTLGTLSYLIPVKDNGKPLTVAYSGGMGFNFPRSPERFDTYIKSAEKMRDAAKSAGASIVFSNHSMYDHAWTRSRVTRKPGEDSPFLIGTEAVERYFTVLRECAIAGKMRLRK